jgi:putative FmdB family regulatory protein
VPRYQYACTEPACGQEFEAVQSFSDAALTECPVCQGRLRKVFSAVGVVFKGSGFYRTDSRSDNGSKSNSSSSPSSSNGSDSSGGSATKSDSSPSSTSSSSGTGGTNSASTPSKAAAAS